MTCWQEIVWMLKRCYWLARHPRRRVEISILVPFQAERSDSRSQIWAWTRRYWRYHLPDAEIIVGSDDGRPFSKTAAVNDAARRAHGSIYVILDADAYLYPAAIVESAQRIGEAMCKGRQLWFVPYRRFYRLTTAATEKVLTSSVRHPVRFSSPPSPGDIEHIHRPHYGHHYGAMVMIMAAEAFWCVGGMDPRYRGWGGEDISFLHALDTLYGPHRTINNDVFHLNHSRIGLTWDTTMWEGQDKPIPHHALASRYDAARNDRARMRALVDEALPAAADRHTSG